MHYRQRIRDAIANRLADAQTLAGGNVFTSRARPVLEILQRRESVLSIYTADENSTRSQDGYTLERTLTVSIEGMAGGGDELDDTLDDFAQQVEVVVDADPRLGGLLSDDMELTSTTSEITARGNQQVGAFRLDFECKYLTERVIDDGPEYPLPTQVTINPEPTPQAYVQPLNSAQAEPPDIVPSEILQDMVAPSRAPEPVKTACTDGSCDLPAWTGDAA